MNETYKARLGLLPVLAERATAGHIGRTALMKYLYFLQVLKGVPLEYNFSLYSYGPFDSDVLADLSTAESLNIVDVTPVEFSGGYGYQIRAGCRAASAKDKADSFLQSHRRDLDWLFATFGDLNSAELELASTIVYVDRELEDHNQTAAESDVAARVCEIKPHFSREHVRRFVQKLMKQSLLTSTIS
jgi:uncharacterized protein YwgA